MANRDQERGLTNQRVRQRENDGRHHQPPQPTVAGSARNPGYNVPRSMLQQVRSPAESHRGQTTLPSNPEAGRKGEPPTPPREHGTPRSLPQTTQPPGNALMSVSDGSPSNGMASTEPPNLTGSVEKAEQFPGNHGGYADVWKCRYYRGGNSEREEMVAVKCIRLLGEQNQQERAKAIKRYQGEVHLWVTLTAHRHVLPLYGTVDGFAPLPALVSPWAENGTLADYVGRDHRRLSYDRKLEIILDVTSGLHHLHSSNICHGDLTGHNILIDRNEDVLISDFGLSSIVAEFNRTDYFQSCKPGAIRWADPQLVIDLINSNGGPLPRKNMTNDIYSMGCIILQVATGLVPYHDKHDCAVQFVKPNWENPVIPDTVSRNLANLMVRCWDRDHRQRPKLDKIEEAVRNELSH
ncbi:hypothetical protein PISMIDRAFT_688321 [Pisolithus microcarpus 441]|uniref:Protein kinase domain-containing protein n=1 Tax=Pisolithus microcarpus 441 TaxID=765257 RepID=A0A0C9YJG7_9AGAM|nr:hypothetical protein PISMIDRAFT_688321 [Pisolithus microcarpus 441]